MIKEWWSREISREAGSREDSRKLGIAADSFRMSKMQGKEKTMGWLEPGLVILKSCRKQGTLIWRWWLSSLSAVTDVGKMPKISELRHTFMSIGSKYLGTWRAHGQRLGDKMTPTKAWENWLILLLPRWTFLGTYLKFEIHNRKGKREESAKSKVAKY